MSVEDNHEGCKECGAISHGNMFCNTCRQFMNKTYGFDLPPWQHKAEKPCGAEEVQKFIAKIDAINAHKEKTP